MRVALVLKSVAMAGVLALVASAGAGEGSPAEAGGGGCHRALEMDGTGDRVVARGSCFEPLVLRVDPGTHVTFTNEDGFDHVVWGGPNMPPLEAALEPGASATRAFSEPGIYPYYCNLHFAMTGVVIVGDGKFVEKAGSAGAPARGGDPVQAARAQPGGSTSASETEPRSAATAPAAERESWPFVVGAAMAVTGFVAGATIATFGMRRSR